AARAGAHADLPVSGPIRENAKAPRHVRGADGGAVVATGVEERVLEVGGQEVDAHPRLEGELLGEEPRLVGYEDVATVEEAALHAGLGVDKAQLAGHELGRRPALGPGDGRRRVDGEQGVAALVVAV